MQQNLTEQMLKGIAEILFEFRKGNTSFRIPQTSRDRFPDEVIDVVNLAAEKLHAGIETPDREILQHYVRVITVSTDFEFTMTDYSRNFEDVIGFDDLIGVGLGEFVHELWDLRVMSYKIITGRNQCLLFPVDFYRNDDIITACGTMTKQKRGSLSMNFITIHQHTKTVPKLLRTPGQYTKYWDIHYEKQISIINIKQYIESNEGAYSPSALAEKFHIPAHRITSVFALYYGFYFSDFIRKTRLIRAADKLIHTNEPINAIALAEFDSYRGFYGAFVKFFGVPPGKVRPDQ